MIYREIGATGIKASVVALGTFPLGGWMWGGVDRRVAVDAIRAALDSGINLIDAAPLYGYGLAEEMIGEAIKGRPRDQIVISTKCGLRFDRQSWPEGLGEHHFYYNNAGLSQDPSDKVCRRCLRAESIMQEVDESLRRLKTDYIDVYFTHAQEKTTPLEETVDALTRLKEQGKIRAIGCSNVSADEMRQYLELGELAADQERFSLVDRTIERNGLADLCRENNVAFFAYSALENGLLSGAIKPGTVFPKGDWRNDSPRFAPENLERAAEMLKRLQPLAEERKATFAQLAIAWIFSRIPTGFVLCGMRSPERVAANAAAGEIELTPEEVEFMADAAENCGLAEDEINRKQLARD